MGKEPGLHNIQSTRFRCVTLLAVVFLAPISNLRQGKTFLLSFLLIRRLLKGFPTVYHVADEACNLFSDQVKGTKVDIESLFALGYNEKRVLWILTDGSLEKVQWKNLSLPWFIVASASPKVEASREWPKERSPCAYFMRNWEWGEIVAGSGNNHSLAFCGPAC